jgi:hypothetical protein
MAAGVALTLLLVAVALAIWAVPAIRNHELLTGTGVGFISFLVGHKHPELIRLAKAVKEAIPPPKALPPALIHAIQSTAATTDPSPEKATYLLLPPPQPHRWQLPKEKAMSLTWNDVETCYHNLCTKLKADFADLETILTKAQGIMSEALPIVDAACSAVGGPVGTDVMAVLTAVNATVNVVQSAVQPAGQVLAAGTITATQAANIAVAAAQALSASKTAVATAAAAIDAGHH